MGEVCLGLVVIGWIHANSCSDVLARQVHIVSELARRDASRPTRFNHKIETHSFIRSATCNLFSSLGTAFMEYTFSTSSVSEPEVSFSPICEDSGDATLDSHQHNTLVDEGDAIRPGSPPIALFVASVEKKRFPHLQFDFIESTGIASTACCNAIRTITSRRGDGSDGVDQAMRPSKRLKSWHVFDKNAKARAEESNEF